MNTTQDLLRLGAHIESDDLAAGVRSLASQTSVIRFDHRFVRDAYHCAASHVHVEATRAGRDARFRIDGVVSALEPLAETESLIFITPRVIRTEEDAAKLTDPMRQQSGRNDR